MRLLTGVARYNEMTYIFDLLHQSHSFEALLRKKLDTGKGQVSKMSVKTSGYWTSNSAALQKIFPQWPL